MGKNRSGTLQKLVQVERYIVSYLFRLVQPVHVQQVVEQVNHMAAYNSDIVQVNVPPFSFPCVHRQFSVAADDVQRGADIVRHGQDDVLAHFQQCGILFYRLFQTFPCPCLFAQVPLDNQV